MKPAWFSEIEAFPSAVLAHHWPDVKNLGDMTKISRRVLLGEIEAPDVLVGGTPCQAFSVAGMREGMADERGQLTMKYVELANAIDTVRVRAGNPETVIVWENVPGVLSDKQNAFGCFLGALAGEDRELQPSGKKWTNAGCVYGPQRAVAWRVLDAQYFGVAQRRRRVFVVASARTDFDPAAVLFERESVRRDSAPSRSQGQELAADAGSRVKSPSHWEGGPHPTLNQSHNTGGIGASNQELFSQRGAGIVGQAVAIQNATRGKSQNGLGVASPGEPMYTLDRASQHAVTVALRGREGGATAELGGEVATALRASSGGGDKPHVLTVHGTQDPCVSDSTAFSLGRNNGGENAVYAFQPGNLCRGAGANPNCDVFPTVKADHGRGLSDQFPHVSAGLAVRRLTPTECERLQGFPDSHTAVPYRNKPASDGPRYKAIGNSMAVPCMSWIGSRLTAFMGGAS